MKNEYLYCLESDLERVDEVGTQSASKIVDQRDAVLRGERGNIQIIDLENIRPQAPWKQWIAEGKLSLDFPAIPASPVKVSSAAAAPPKSGVAADTDLSRIYQILEKFESRFDSKFKNLESRFDSKFEKLESRFDSRFENLESTVENNYVRMEHAVKDIYQHVDSRLEGVAQDCSKANELLQSKILENEATIEKRCVAFEHTVAHMSNLCTEAEGTAAEALRKANAAIDHSSQLYRECDGKLNSLTAQLEQVHVVEDADGHVKEEDDHMSQFFKDMNAVTPSVYKAPRKAGPCNNGSSIITSSQSKVAMSELRSRERSRSPSSPRMHLGSSMITSSPFKVAKNEVRSRERSRSPTSPRMQLYTGDLNKMSWSSFISRFCRTADRRGWDDPKRLDKLLDCLSEKALEFANRSKAVTFNELVKELELRFDNRNTPIAARNRLHLIKQSDEETLEEYLQRVITLAMEGYSGANDELIMTIPTEAFLRGCRDKEAALLVMNEAPTNIQDACRRLKSVVANRKAIQGERVTFKERLFTAQEEDRVAALEKKVQSMSVGGGDGPREYAYRGQEVSRGRTGNANYPDRSNYREPYYSRGPSPYPGRDSSRSPGHPQRPPREFRDYGGIRRPPSYDRGQSSGRGYGRPQSYNSWDNRSDYSGNRSPPSRERTQNGGRDYRRPQSRSPGQHRYNDNHTGGHDPRSQGYGSDSRDYQYGNRDGQTNSPGQHGSRDYHNGYRSPGRDRFQSNPAIAASRVPSREKSQSPSPGLNENGLGSRSTST